MVKKSISAKTIISFTISILFLVYLYVNRHSILSSLKDIRLEFFALVIIGQILAQISNSFILLSSLKPLGVPLKGFESFRLTVVSSFVNFFTPVVGGASTKAVYLKSKHGLNYPSFVGALYANYVITFLVSFIFGLLGVLMIPNAISMGVGITLVLFFSVGIVGSIFFIIAGHKVVGLIRKIPIKNKVLKNIIHKISLVDEGWQNIRGSKITVAQISFWSACAMASLMLIYWSSIMSIGLKTNLGSFMIYAALASVSLLLNLTPGSIGVRETLYASIRKLSGINAEQVVTFSLVDRAAQLIVLGTSWLFFGNSILKDVDFNKNKLKNS